MKRMIKKSGKKGFTLVELIVVLVILAIMAAILIPALTGYIDRAREQNITQNAATILTAAQACASEDYGMTAKASYAERDVSEIDIGNQLFPNSSATYTIAKLTSLKAGDYLVSAKTNKAGVIIEFSVKDVKNKKLATWNSDNGNWSIEDYT